MIPSELLSGPLWVLVNGESAVPGRTFKVVATTVEQSEGHD
jgi:hypothetical protein